MKYILEAAELSEIMTLTELLNWVSFSAPPLSEYPDDDKDEKYENPRTFFPNNEYPFRIKGSLDFNEIEECPEYPDIMGTSTIEYIKSNEKSKDELEKLRKLEEQSIQEHSEYEAKYKRWEDSVNLFQETAKSEIFLALKKGELTASGDIMAIIRDDIPTPDWSDDESWEEIDNIPYNEVKTTGSLYMCLMEENQSVYDELSKDYPKETLKAKELFSKYNNQKISPKCWIMAGINWEYSLLASKEVKYSRIFFETDDVFNIFPMPEITPVKIGSLAGTLIMDDNQIGKKSTQINKIGRKPYNWKEFTEEMARRITNHELPDLQKICVIDMREWCINAWGKTPSETNLKEHISPFYKALKSQKINSNKI